MAVRGFQPGTITNNGIGLTLFSDDELERVHLSTCDLLWRVGVQVESKQAREIYGDGGCVVDEAKNRVRIPAWLTEWAIQVAPATFRAAARVTENDFICEYGRTGFVNFGEAPAMIDPQTRAVRLPTTKDVDDMNRFLDYLPNVDVYERPLTPSDVVQEVSCVYNAKSFFENVTKHGYIGINSVENMRTIFEMACVVTGGKENFLLNPIFSSTSDPISPLLQSREGCDAMIEAARLGIPMKINPLALPGGTSNVNLGATLVSHNAEVLSMFVLGQLVRKGHPMVYGSSTSMMDLRTTLASMGCPEMGLFSAAITKLAQYYRLPVWVAGG